MISVMCLFNSWMGKARVSIEWTFDKMPGSALTPTWPGTVEYWGYKCNGINILWILLTFDDISWTGARCATARTNCLVTWRTATWTVWLNDLHILNFIFGMVRLSWGRNFTKPRPLLDTLNGSCSSLVWGQWSRELSWWCTVRIVTALLATSLGQLEIITRDQLLGSLLLVRRFRWITVHHDLSLKNELLMYNWDGKGRVVTLGLQV